MRENVAMATRMRVLLWALAAAVTPIAQVAAQDGLGTLLEESSQPQAAAEPAQPDGRAPVPSNAASRQALADVKDIFRDDYAKATNAQTRVALARTLLSQADKTSAPIERWVLLSEAMRLASDAGDIEISFEAIEKSMQTFAVDGQELKLDALMKLAAKCPPQALESLTRTVLAMARTTAETGDAAVASKTLSLAATLARKTKNRSLVADVAKMQQAAKDQEKESRELEAMASKLAAAPDDADVCLEAGKYFCFKGGDWKKGLPLLAKGSDTDLSRLAVAELNVGKAGAAVISLGDAWWEWAEKTRGNDKAAALNHAIDLYATALKYVDGLERARLEKRIQQAQAEPRHRGKRVSLADAKPESTKNIFGTFTQDGTFQGKPFTCLNQAWPKALMAHVADANSGPSVIIYRVPDGARRLIGKAGIFTAANLPGQNIQPLAPQQFEVWVDGNVAWQSPPLSKREETADFDVPIYGASAVELRVSTKSQVAGWCAWLNPEFGF